MKFLSPCLCIGILFYFCLTTACFSGGTYYIGKDQGGIYFQTDNDGGWYIDYHDLKHFKIGETGEYISGVDHNGEFILTEKKKYYVDTGRKEALENEIDVFNEKQNEKFEKLETDVAIDGNRVLVPVTIRYGGKTTTAQLLLDTGASIVTLHRNVAEKLKINSFQKTTVQLAGGQSIAADIARLDGLSVGPNRKKNIFVTIIDQIDLNADYDGLLGMNFLRNLRYEIDFHKSVIRWYR